MKQNDQEITLRTIMKQNYIGFENERKIGVKSPWVQPKDEIFIEIYDISELEKPNLKLLVYGEI